MVLSRGSLKFNCTKSCKLKLQSFVPQLSLLKPFRGVRNGSYLAAQLWALLAQMDLWALSFQADVSPLLEDHAAQGALGPLDFGRLCRSWNPVPIGSGTVADDAFFVELLNKLDTKSCSEIAPLPAPSSGKLSKITILLID